MNNYHAILKHPYNDISGVAQHWASRAHTFMVAEHPAEGKTKVVHCHILIIGSPVKKNELRKKAKEIYPALSGDSRILESYTDISGTKTTPDKSGATYLLKGEISRLKFSKNFSQEELDKAVSAGYNPNKAKTSNTTAKSKQSERRVLYEEMMKELPDVSYSAQQVFKAILTVLTRNYKGASESSVISYYGMIVENFDDLKQSYVSKLVERVSPRF